MPDSLQPMNLAHQVPLFMGFPRQEYWSGLPFPSSEDLPDPGIKQESPALAGRFFTSEPPGKPFLKRKKKKELLQNAHHIKFTILTIFMFQYH